MTVRQTLNPQSLPESFVEQVVGIVGKAGVRQGERVASLDPGWHADNLKAGIVVEPADVSEVEALVALCRAHRIAIVSHGGRTGLVGGGISAVGQIALSFACMNRILWLDPVERVAVVQAGCTLQALQEAAAEYGLEPGIDIPSRGTATIGGMISTNAGGIRAFRTGTMRHRVFGLQAVAGTGQTMEDLTRVVKTSAGTDLKHLFIGSEGTLGIVTAAAIKLDAAPVAQATALFTLPDEAAVLDAIRFALTPSVGELLAAEALWNRFLRKTAEGTGFDDPSVDMTAPLALLVELGGSDPDTLRETLETLFGRIVERHPGAGGVIAQSGVQAAQLWRLREETGIVTRAYPGALLYDVSLPQSAIANYVRLLRERMAATDPAYDPYVFGHLADGNLHIILGLDRQADAALSERIDHAVYDGVRALGGSFSAEHGIGSKRVSALARYGDPGKLALMKVVKAALDPDGILNPGKVLG